jgi:hypothetical protein
MTAPATMATIEQLIAMHIARIIIFLSMTRESSGEQNDCGEHTHSQDKYGCLN